MPGYPGYATSTTRIDPLSHYQRSRLGRWEIATESDPNDALFGIELTTPSGPIYLRFETTIHGKAFRADRERTIDDLLELASMAKKNEASRDKPNEQNQDTFDKSASESSPPPKNLAPKAYIKASVHQRLASYARSRGDRLTRHELRRRFADIAGGPALLKTTYEFGSQRHETLPLFAFLDTNQDGSISSPERDAALNALNDCDANSNGRLDWFELKQGMNSRTTHRNRSSESVRWKSWDANQSKLTADLNITVSFHNDTKISGLAVKECHLDESWNLSTATMQSLDADSTSSQIALLSRPHFAIAINAAQNDSSHKKPDQVSIGVVLEANALFQQVDSDGNWTLSANERRRVSEIITALDDNADGILTTAELPVLVRLCVGRGVSAHQALSDDITITRKSEQKNRQAIQNSPAWFSSMDQDGDRTLTREEFLGVRESFDKIDADQNDRLSVEEVLNAQPD